jgi:hypothetical protein
MIGAGPYLAYMGSAKDKFGSTPFSDGGDFQQETQQYNPGAISRFDWGMGGFIGLQSPD